MSELLEKFEEGLNDAETFLLKRNEIENLFVKTIKKSITDNSLVDTVNDINEFVYEVFPELEPEKAQDCFDEYEVSFNLILSELYEKQFTDPYVQANSGVEALYLIYFSDSDTVRPVINACCMYTADSHEWIENFSQLGEVGFADKILDWSYLEINFPSNTYESFMARMFMYANLLVASCRSVSASKFKELPFTFSCYNSPTELVDIPFSSREDI